MSNKADKKKILKKENTLLVNCILMCFIISCFTAGALALYRSVGRSLYYYDVYEFVTRKTRSDCARIRYRLFTIYMENPFGLN